MCMRKKKNETCLSTQKKIKAMAVKEPFMFSADSKFSSPLLSCAIYFSLPS